MVSHEATVWAWGQLWRCGTPAERITLLAVAWLADRQGVTWAGPKTLMGMVNIERRSLKRCLSGLADRGLLIRYARQRKDGSNGAALTILNMPEALDLTTYEFIVGAVLEGVTTRSPSGGSHREVMVTGPSPGSVSTTDSFLAEGQEVRADASERPVKYRGKKVPSPIVQGAEELLGDYNEATGRQVGSRTASGDPSPALRQIIGAMLARPEVRPDAWAAGIRATVANPPGWINGRGVQIGDVFGERAAEWALSNAGRAAEATARDPAKQGRVDEFMTVLARFTGGGG